MHGTRLNKNQITGECEYEGVTKEEDATMKEVGTHCKAP